METVPQKLAPQERCVLRRDIGSFEKLGGTRSNVVGIIYPPCSLLVLIDL